MRLRTPLVMNVWDDDDGSFTKKKKKVSIYLISTLLKLSHFTHER